MATVLQILRPGSGMRAELPIVSPTVSQSVSQNTPLADSTRHLLRHLLRHFLPYYDSSRQQDTPQDKH